MAGINYQNIVENSNQGLFIINDHKIIFANRAASRLCAVPSEELLTRPIADFVHPDYLPFPGDFTSGTSPICTTGIELRLRDASGDIKWVHVYAVHSETPLPGSVYYYVRDITNRKNIEDALKLSEDKFSKAFKLSPSSIMIMSMEDHIIRDVNDAFMIHTGYTHDELVGHVADSVKIWYNFNMRKQLLDSLLDSGTVNNYEMPFLNKSGEERLASISAAIIDISSSKHAVFLISDITDQKRIEISLMQSEEKYRHLFSAVSEAIIIFDIDTFQIIDANLAATKQYGYTHDEIIAIRLTDLSAEPDKTIEFLSSLKSGNPTDIPLRYHKKKNGRVFPVEITSGFFMLGDRSVGISASRDITKRKNLEEEFNTAQKYEAIAMLAGGIAHDFNNILTAILGNVSLAKMQINPDEEAFESIQEIEKASIQAKDISFQLLNYGKMSKPSLQKASVDFLVKDPDLTAGRSNAIKFEINTSPDLWDANIDVSQIHRVLMHLVQNAQDAMPDGGTISITAENTRVTPNQMLPIYEGKYVKVTIGDTGVGIPPENLTRIFDPYFSTKKKYSDKGAGLGLALVYSIIKRHRGLITVKSEAGKGSVFTMYLPA
jgi:PAS domain S-box-containing protein